MLRRLAGILAVALCLVVLGAGGAMAEVQLGQDRSVHIDNATADAFYEACVLRIPDKFTGGAQKGFCACSAAGMQALMSVPEYTALQKDEFDSATGKRARVKYIYDVTMPCLEPAVQEVEYGVCLQRAVVDGRVQYPAAYCRCVAREISSYVSTLGGVDAEKIMIDNKRYTDPVRAMYANSDFIELRLTSRRKCLDSKYWKR